MTMTVPHNQLATLVPKALETLLTETLFRANPNYAYIINRGEPGLGDTLEALSAEVVSTPPRAGRKPVVSHANHVLFGLNLVNRALGGDEHAFDNVDWDAAWRLEQVDDAAWRKLLDELRAAAELLRDRAPQTKAWNEIILTGCLAIAAHTAYHLSAVRQILRDLDGPRLTE